MYNVQFTMYNFGGTWEKFIEDRGGRIGAEMYKDYLTWLNLDLSSKASLFIES